MSKNSEKVKFLKKQSEFNRRKRIQRWMNELRQMIKDDWSVQNSTNIKLDKIDLLEYAIKQIQFYNSSFQVGYENCQSEIVTCLNQSSSNDYQSCEQNSNPANLSLIIVNKLNETMANRPPYTNAGQKRDVLLKLRQKIIENKRKKCIKFKMNLYNSDGGTVDDDVWRPW